MEITLKFGSFDAHAKLSTYDVQKEVSYVKVITTMDETEHAVRGKDRYVLSVSFFPMTENESSEYYESLSASVVSVTFTDPYSAADVTKQMRVTSNLDAIFALKSIDGNRRYIGGAIQLREI